jgi:hypothetical protein
MYCISEVTVITFTGHLPTRSAADLLCDGHIRLYSRSGRTLRGRNSECSAEVSDYLVLEIMSIFFVLLLIC